MYYSPASKQYSAVNCSSNSYGVANTTYGLGAYPCRDCPAGMQTSVSLPSSAAFYFSEGDVAGFTNPMACVTKPGYGYNGRVATACPAGSYNAAGNYGTCTKCAAGFSTPANPEQQVSVDNCAVAQGFGLADGAIVPCPVGECHCCLRGLWGLAIGWFWLLNPLMACGMRVTFMQPALPMHSVLVLRCAFDAESAPAQQHFSLWCFRI